MITSLPLPLRRNSLHGGEPPIALSNSVANEKLALALSLSLATDAGDEQNVGGRL